MKKTISTAVIALVLALALGMSACSSYGKVEKAFVNAGYTKSETLEGISKDIQNELSKNSGTKELAVVMHVFSKDLKIALVIEFKATKDMLEFYKESSTAQGFVKDVTENEDANAFYKSLVDAGYANGNCLVLPLVLTESSQNEIKDIVKKA